MRCRGRRWLAGLVIQAGWSWMMMGWAREASFCSARYYGSALSFALSLSQSTSAADQQAWGPTFPCESGRGG